MPNFLKTNLTATGQTGNNTHTGVPIHDGYDSTMLQFVVEVAGGTPTVTWKFQGSNDTTDGSNGNWYDIAYVTDSSDTAAVATIVSTAVGAKAIFPVRPYKWIRLVTSSNTNITYRAECYRTGCPVIR